MPGLVWILSALHGIFRSRNHDDSVYVAALAEETSSPPRSTELAVLGTLFGRLGSVKQEKETVSMQEEFHDGSFLSLVIWVKSHKECMEALSQ